MMLYACYYYVACGRRHGRCAVLERGVGLGRDVVWASVPAAFAGGGGRGVRGIGPRHCAYGVEYRSSTRVEYGAHCKLGLNPGLNATRQPARRGRLMMMVRAVRPRSLRGSAGCAAGAHLAVGRTVRRRHRVGAGGPRSRRGKRGDGRGEHAFEGGWRDKEIQFRSCQTKHVAHLPTPCSPSLSSCCRQFWAIDVK